MARKKRYLDTRILTVFFLVAIPFVALGSFVVVDMAKGSLQTALGQSFEQRATETKLLIERYVAAQIVHSRLLALDPEVRRALTAPVKEAANAESHDLEQRWVSGDAKLTEVVVGSSLGTRLKEIMALRPEVRLIQVIDGAGRLLASTSRSGRAFYGDQPWFKGFHDDPLRVEPFIGSVGAHVPAAFEVAHPVRDSADGHLLGVLRVATDWTGFYGILAPVRIGRTGHALLLAGDGRILVSDVNEPGAFPGFPVLQEALQGFPLNEHADKLFGAARGQRGYWTLPEARGEATAATPARVTPARIVGFARVDQVPDVDWIVTIEQDLKEAVAPIQGVTRYLWIHFIGAFGTVILLALYFSFVTETPAIEEGLHLHEEHVPAGVHSEA